MLSEQFFVTAKIAKILNTIAINSLLTQLEFPELSLNIKIMKPIFLFFLCFLSIQVHANSHLQLDKHLGANNQTSNSTNAYEQKSTNLRENIANLEASEQHFLKAHREFEIHRQSLAKQLDDAKQTLPPAPKINLTQQASMAYLRLSELKEIEASLGQQITNDLLRQKQLPQLISSARESLQQHQKNLPLPKHTPTGELQQLQQQLYQQNLKTLEAEFASSANRVELSQLQLQVIRQQLLQQEQLIEKFNIKISAKRQQTTDATLANNVIDSLDIQDPLIVELNETNREYGALLQNLTQDTQKILSRQEQAEKLYQRQAKQLTNIQEQVTWIKLNAAFGERFLKILQALAKPPDPQKLQNQIADTRLARYQIEQQRNINEQELSLNTNYNPLQEKLLNSQQILLSKLIEGYDMYLNELSKLKLSYEQLRQQYITIKNTLNEHLFWVPNAAYVSKIWFIDVYRSAHWLINQAPWQQIPRSLTEQSELWSWWIILVVLSLVSQDLVAPKFRTYLKQWAALVGNVTQDKFIFTFKALVGSIAYSAVWPFPIISAGFILYVSPHNFVQAGGAAVIATGLIYLLYRFYYLLSLDNGVLTAHFKKSRTFIEKFQLRLRHFMLLAIPLVAIMAFTEVLDTSLVRNSLGRGAFIIFCLLLIGFYKDVLIIIKKLNTSKTFEQKNKKLLHKLLWLIMFLVPCATAALAIFGYYFTAFQMLLQLQVSLILGIGFLLIYELIQRWMLIERRRIAFDRAKAKRAEIIAQREKGELTTNDLIDNYEEPIVDLDTISSQSLGLVHSLLLLAFFASLIGMWSQTHTALFSFLDSITLWTSSATINGMEQQIPITLKSLLSGLIIVGFSLMIATNLPGLLELMLLQRLDLSPGTGFAITTVSRYLVVFFGTLVSFSTLGMEWSKLQWLVAALSVGLGFGLQEIFANFISGLIILFEKPIRIGDTVTIRELTGTVSKIQIRATTIIDWDRKEIIVPNKAFITEQLVNWSLSDPITRVIAYIAVARDSDPAKVEAVLYQAVKECSDALLTPEPEVWFAGFGQHTQNYEVRAYAKDMSSRWPLRHSLHKRITKKLKENDLELAYPQLEVHVKSNQPKEKYGLIK